MEGFRQRYHRSNNIIINIFKAYLIYEVIMKKSNYNWIIRGQGTLQCRKL